MTVVDKSAGESADGGRAAVRKWKGRAAELAAQIRELAEQAQALKARVAATEQAVRVAKHEVSAARHASPSVSVVRDTFGHRLRTLPARVRARSAPDGEERLMQVSPAYRSALERGAEALEGVAYTTSIEGLTWREPLRIGKAAPDAARTEAHRFPYHGILQTRELAIGGIMLDLGANVGRMSVPRVILGDVAYAYCAEPDPVTFACLARNVIDNGLRGLVLPDQTAIGDRDGTVQLLRSGGSGNFRVVRDAADRTIEVPCATLDTWVERLGVDLEGVTFVKVDVEGFERRVLAGANRVLACRHIAWQMEIKPAGLRNAGDEPHALYADLTRAFTHFIDLNRRVAGPRVRPVAELAVALEYIDPDGKTDILLFSEARAADGARRL